MSVNKSNTFEFEVLKQHIAELEAENSRVLAEKAELLKQIAEERAKYKAENAKLKSRVAKLEQDYGQVQSDLMPLVSLFTRSEPVVIPDCETKDAVLKVQFSTNNSISANSKTSEDREMDAFLDDAYKKSVSDGIR
ncbi:hypothetical protein GLOIN_2v1739352 [Rhizophagus clarus]|uniref:Uncharacterized protein n=1 Tax=Rhizophagus clarus TaxID=94130 RepID=A0A8H3QK20_9GLOM|nr:hypothetical protein GLOIN_2v1739352 [Rhizophagus clarus]